MVNKKHGKTRTVPHRRKREGKTSYKKRLTLLKSCKSRLVVRKSLNTIITQLVDYMPDGDKIIVSATSKDLQKMGWKMHKANMPSAYLTGLLLGARAKKKNLSKAVLDLGIQSPLVKGKLFAVVKGAIDGGLDLDCGEEAFPDEDRITGKHIADYATKLKSEPDKYNKQFSSVVKQGGKPEEITQAFEETKKKILAL